MKDVLSNLYELVWRLFNPDFSLIFNPLYDNGSYIWFGLIFIFIPLLMWSLFYFAWRSPYGKLWHWLIWLMVTFLIVGVVTWRVSEGEIFESDNEALNGAIADPETGYLQYAQTLPLKYALYNSLMALVLSFIYSLILKQWSKLQIHLPF